jgi:DNA-binding NtrC family response regulator
MPNERIIFIADDDAQIRELTQIYLDQAVPDCVYEVFENGQVLEARLKAGDLERVALAVIDNTMPPGPKGSEIIAKYARSVDFPFILHYADSVEIGEQAVSDGAVAYFRKPDSWADLASRAQRLLQTPVGTESDKNR